MKRLRVFLAGIFVVVCMSGFAWAEGFRVGELLATGYDSVYMIDPDSDNLDFGYTTGLDLVTAVPEPSALISLLAATLVGLLALGLLSFLGRCLGSPIVRGAIGMLYGIITGALMVTVVRVFGAELFGNVHYSGLWTLVLPHGWDMGLVMSMAVGGMFGASYGVFNGRLRKCRPRNHLADHNVLEFIGGLEETKSTASATNEGEATTPQPTIYAVTEFLPEGVTSPWQAESEADSKCVSLVPTSAAAAEHHDSHPPSKPKRSDVRSRSSRNPTSSIF